MSDKLPELNAQELPSILAAMGERFGWEPGMASAVAVTQWESRKAAFGRVTTGADREIIVKQGIGWTPEDARFVYEELGRLTALVADLDIAVPEPLGWAESPPLVAMGATDGDILFTDILTDLGAWPGDAARLVELVTRCGRAIGKYHAAQPAGDDADLEAAARADLRRAARRSLVRRSTAVAAAAGLPRARGFRFSPNDFLVAADGRLILLDPPHVRKYDYVHRDVSSFTFEVDRALRGKDRATAMKLNRAFVEGYRSEGLCDPAEGRHRWAVRLYETSRITGLAYGRLQRRRVREAAGAVGWAIRQRASLGWRGTRPPS